jgi:hypothetical protein
MLGPRKGRLRIRRRDGVVAICRVDEWQPQGVVEHAGADGYYTSTWTGRTIRLWLCDQRGRYRVHSKLPARAVIYTLTEAELYDETAYERGLRALIQRGSDNAALVERTLEKLLYRQ